MSLLAELQHEALKHITHNNFECMKVLLQELEEIDLGVVEEFFEKHKLQTRYSEKKERFIFPDSDLITHEIFLDLLHILKTQGLSLARLNRILRQCNSVYIMIPIEVPGKKGKYTESYLIYKALM